MFIWPIRIYYEDTDCGAVVYYANYLKFMERARSEWLRQLGFEQDRLMERYGVVFAVQSAQLRFLRPGRFNELLYVSAATARRGGASLTFDQHVVRAADASRARDLLNSHRALSGSGRSAADAEILCSGVIKVACLDTDGMRPRRIPEEMMTELAREC
jgi:acyl-CoA thioester hydrolase